MKGKEIAKKVFLNNFGAKPHERVLVFTDLIGEDEKISEAERARRQKLPEIAELFHQGALELGLDSHLILYESTKAHGKEPPEVLWREAWGDEFVDALRERGLFSRILEKENLDYGELLKIVETFKSRRPDIVVALSNFSTTHTTFRKLLTDTGSRYASMPLFDEEMLYGCLNVDVERLKTTTVKVAHLLSRADAVRIEAPNGTRLYLDTSGREALSDTGDLTRPGSFSNLPAGEAFIAPVEGKGEGVLVVEWAPTRRLAAPVAVEIKGGRAVSVKGDDEYARFLSHVFSTVENADNVAELGVGTNPKAKRADNILEAEKILGSIHIAFGDNSTFGGRTKASFHQDHVVFSPTVEVKVGEEWLPLMKAGTLVI
ncbi:MAG: aminopeptidase [Deferribacteres bacterium]|nr:aminopeptidase [Deferribacteres bacterium]